MAEVKLLNSIFTLTLWILGTWAFSSLSRN